MTILAILLFIPMAVIILTLFWLILFIGLGIEVESSDKFPALLGSCSALCILGYLILTGVIK